jgi:hypothetical protein
MRAITLKKWMVVVLVLLMNYATLFALERANGQQVLGVRQLYPTCSSNKVMYEMNYKGKVFTLYGDIFSVKEEDIYFDEGYYYYAVTLCEEVLSPSDNTKNNCGDGMVEIIYGKKALNKVSGFKKGETFREEVVGTDNCDVVIAAISIDEFRARNNNNSNNNVRNQDKKYQTSGKTPEEAVKESKRIISELSKSKKVSNMTLKEIFTEYPWLTWLIGIVIALVYYIVRGFLTRE